MKSNWSTKKLGDITSYTSKGIAPKYMDTMKEGAICVLNQKCNRNFKITYDYARIHDGNLKKVALEKILMPGDVLINSTGTGTAGRVAQLNNVMKPTTVDGHMIIMRPTNEVDSLYYGYALKSKQSIIETLAEGSTGQTEINRKRLSDEIQISFPNDLKKQRKIALILYAIDNKIETNNQINNNLYT